MITETCVNCGEKAAVVRSNYSFKDMGIPVQLQNIEVIQCSECGTVEPVIPNINGLMRTLATAIICNPRKLGGEEVRFLRKYAGKSASEFSRFLHVDPTHLSKIENNKTEIGAGLDKLVRLLVANMNPELKDHVQELMNMIPDIDDSANDEVHSLRVDPETMDCHYELV